jgi:tripartite-type tricarboxylate transporter receptor subunit TctC
MFAAIPSVAAHIRAGQMRAIGVSSARRAGALPDVPTVAESGVPGFAVDNWYGFQAPRGVPTPIAMKLHSEINRIMTMADVTARLAGLGIFPFTLPTHTAYGQYIQSEIKKYGEVVRGAGVKAD